MKKSVISAAQSESANHYWGTGLAEVTLNDFGMMAPELLHVSGQERVPDRQYNNSSNDK